jgi:L-ascorbate metabolism protein UlaG (beta-lactamase superfamily)
MDLPLMKTAPDPIITYISHACIRIDGEFGSLLTDPWILNEPVYTFTTWKFPAAIVPPEQVMKNLDYLYISHAHEDHFHIPSLDLFPRDIKIIIPQFVRFASLRAQTMERTLRSMGFHHIIKLKPWESISLSQNSRFHLVPACDTKFWDWENSGFVLEHPGLKILNMNDCPADGLTYSQIRKSFNEIDLAFIQYSGVSMFPGCYRLTPEEMKKEASQKKAGWQQQKYMLELLNIKAIIPFAGDFAWLDDRMLHCNWSNRATPRLFEAFVQNNYPNKNIDVHIMNPSDQWSKQTGLIRNHPEINWDRYLESIHQLKKQLQPKIDNINHWINASDCSNLRQRTDHYMNHINQWICQEHITFNLAIEINIEGQHSNYCFYINVTTEKGFKLVWEKPKQIAQVLYIRESLWAGILEGKLLFNTIQWACENKQLCPFRPEIGRFWFWFEAHIDLNNRNTQALIDPALHGHIQDRIRPNHGVFPLEDEWECKWLAEQPVYETVED